MKEALGIEESSFVHWMYVQRPEMLIAGTYDAISAEALNDWRGLNHPQFFQRYVAEHAAARA